MVLTTMMTTWKSAALAALVVAVPGCGAEPEPETEVLSWQAVVTTVTTQESIAFDEEAAWEIQREALDRCWTREPLLMCVNPTPPWDPTALITRAVPADIEAAWARGELISSNEAMNRFIEEFQIVRVSPAGNGNDGLYKIEFAPTPIAADGYRYSTRMPLLRMDRLAERLNREVDGLEVETMELAVPLILLDQLSVSQESSGRAVHWEWAESLELGWTIWDCRVPDDPEAEVELEISGYAPSYSGIERCLDGIEEGRFPL